MVETLFKATWQITKPQNVLFFNEFDPETTNNNINLLLQNNYIKYREEQNINENTRQISYYWDSENQYYEYLYVVNQPPFNSFASYDQTNGITNSTIFLGYITVDVNTLNLI